MILNFSIENFGSIKEEQTLSFEADKSSHLEDTYVINIGKYRVLKLALIYGANASGKTTILKAIEFLRNIVLFPKLKKTEELNFLPFLFDAKTPQQPSVISIEFLQNEIKYFYKIEFSTQAILSEELYFYNPKKANVFKRKTNLQKQLTEITFGSKIFISEFAKNTLKTNTLWNEPVFSGYLKTNINVRELQDSVLWFKDYLDFVIYPETKLASIITERIYNEIISKTDVLNLFRKADFNISDINIRKVEKDIFSYSINLGATDTVSKEKGKVVNTELNFVHTVNGQNFYLPLKEESQGTLRYYDFAGLLVALIKNNTVGLVDELESSLHPDLYSHFLVSFLINAQKSQLIATTHNREILDNKDLFRNDAIWFTDKQNNCATELYSLADFDSSVIRNTSNILNAYKSGKLSGTPNLGDTFIDF